MDMPGKLPKVFLKFYKIMIIIWLGLFVLDCIFLPFTGLRPGWLLAAAYYMIRLRSYQKLERHDIERVENDGRNSG